MSIFFLVRRRRKKTTLYAIRRGLKTKLRLIFLFAVIDKNKLAPFAIRRRRLLFFRHLLIFAVRVAENKLKGAFRYSP